MPLLYKQSAIALAHFLDCVGTRLKFAQAETASMLVVRLREKLNADGPCNLDELSDALMTLYFVDPLSFARLVVASGSSTFVQRRDQAIERAFVNTGFSANSYTGLLIEHLSYPLCLAFLQHVSQVPDDQILLAAFALMTQPVPADASLNNAYFFRIDDQQRLIPGTPFYSTPSANSSGIIDLTPTHSGAAEAVELRSATFVNTSGHRFLALQARSLTPTASRFFNIVAMLEAERSTP